MRHIPKMHQKHTPRNVIPRGSEELRSIVRRGESDFAKLLTECPAFVYTGCSSGLLVTMFDTFDHFAVKHIIRTYRYEGGGSSNFAHVPPIGMMPRRRQNTRSALRGVACVQPVHVPLAPPARANLLRFI